MAWPDKKVSLEKYANNIAVGGGGGVPFTYLRPDDIKLVSMRVWYSKSIKGVKVWMNDSTTRVEGKCDDKYPSQQFDFQQGELISQIRLRPTDGQRLGAIWIATDQGREWELKAKCPEDALLQEFSPEVGSGICCGIFGGGGSDVDRLGFAMLR